MVAIAGLSDQVTVTVGAFADTHAEVLKGKTVDVRLLRVRGSFVPKRHYSHGLTD